MQISIKPIPEGYHSVTPHLIIRSAAKALDFYRLAFGATVKFRLETPDGRIGLAEILIGDSTLMLADEHPESGARSPESWRGSPVNLMLYVGDVDQVFAQAVAAGATVERPVADQSNGDRTGGLKDPFGLVWYVATHIEDVPPEEMARRAEEAGTK